MQFPEALVLVLSGVIVRRVGWRNKFRLEVMREAWASGPFLVRLHDDGSTVLPWGVATADDVRATDWETITGGPFQIVIEEGTTAWAVQRLLAGRSVGMEGSPLRVELDDAGMRLILPNGDRKPFVLAPIDMIRKWTE